MIAHFDLDAFFVSVEVILNPALKGKPLIVGGSRERGVVTTCSYEARKWGVCSAMPMRKAIELCPEATVVQGTRGQYSRFSRQVTDIIASKAPLFEKASIDEFYIDLAGMDRFFDSLAWCINLREEIIRETQLPISFGLATNKMVAKMATNEAKPNGWLQVPAGMEADFLAPLTIDKINGVGVQTLGRLHALGLHTIGDMARFPTPLLEKTLGTYGTELSAQAKGIHKGRVHAYHVAKSISAENTLEQNVDDMDFLMAELTRLTERTAFQLRQENKMAGCVAVKIRYPDFETHTRQASIPYTCYDDELIRSAKTLFRQAFRKGQKIRLLGVRLSELTDGARQTNLFQDTARKSELYKAIDEVKERYGRSALTRGGAMKK